MTKTRFFLDPSKSDAELLSELRRIAPEHWSDQAPSTEDPGELEGAPQPGEDGSPESGSDL